MRIVKRTGISVGKAWGIRGIGLLLALALSAIVIYAIVKLNPLRVYVSMWDGAFGNGRIWITVRDCMILTCIAIGLAPAFKMRFWNIGAEGQILVGGIASAFWMINFGNKLPPVLLFACMIGPALLIGALCGILPAVF